ncbi:MAG TPA: hypothetical protein VGE93_14635, partial [Bryobacteraceae bacterium]
EARNNDPDLKPTGEIIHDYVKTPFVRVGNKIGSNIAGPILDIAQGSIDPPEVVQEREQQAAEQAWNHWILNPNANPTAKDYAEQIGNGVPLITGLPSIIRSWTDSKHPFTDMAGDIGTAALLHYGGKIIADPEAQGEAIRNGAASTARSASQSMQEAAGGIMNRTAGTHTEDLAGGLNPGRSYLDETTGAPTSMRDLADKAAIARDTAHPRVRQQYAQHAASSRPFDAAEVESRLLTPLDDAISKTTGAGSSPTERTLQLDLHKTVRKAIRSRVDRNNRLSAVDLFDINDELTNNIPGRFKEPSSRLPEIMQHQTEALSDYLKDANPDLARDHENYLGLKRLALRADQMAKTKTTPLTHIKDVGVMAGLGEAFGSLLAHKKEGALLAGGSVLASKLARSVPVRTAAARGLYSAGERLGRGADWIDRSAPEAQNTLAQANATQGPEAWQSKGAQKLLEAGFTADEINRLRHTRIGQQILQDAGDVSPNSRAMAAIKQRVRNLR